MKAERRYEFSSSHKTLSNEMHKWQDPRRFFVFTFMSQSAPSTKNGQLSNARYFRLSKLHVTQHRNNLPCEHSLPAHGLECSFPSWIISPENVFQACFVHSIYHSQPIGPHIHFTLSETTGTPIHPTVSPPL